MAWLKARAKDKSIDCSYGFMTGGGISICNADSHETMYRLLMSYPLYAYGDYKVDALCNIATTFEEVKAMAQRAAAASA